MSTIRSVRNRKARFTQVVNDMLEDVNISYRAKGFITFCLSKPENWVFHVSHLARCSTEGKSAIYAVITECVNNGYAYRYQTKDEKTGNFSPIETIISDSKEEIALIKSEIEQNLKKCSPHSGLLHAVKKPLSNEDMSLMKSEIEQDLKKCSPHSGLPHTVNQPLVICTNKSNTKKTATTRSPMAPQPAEPAAAAVFFEDKNKDDQPLIEKSYSCLNQVDISSHDKEEITRKYTPQQVEHAISWLMNNKSPLKKSKAAAIKWACRVQPEIPVDEEVLVKKNWGVAKKYDGCENKYVRISALSQHAEFIFLSSQKQPTILPYKDTDFVEKFRKEGVRCKLWK